ncbi:hypothetical protein ERO13_D02G050900v2 [Gossypium hirsutum]|uniref:At4g15545-like C-terminal domain-containing protein n=1 Tax=Gossypium barbadense TaxID=3634 RepID=A0A5J5S932_GOSBA|nr:hypothetical protein ES319_D02G057600v1 [Gossypium barbadense]KAG4157249.1 hypothetical protein ERO13_D02G050900v2 [Gossypium hirsutum]
MLAEESDGSTSTFDLPDEILRVLPSDPFQQLDVARKLTSIALSARISLLEAETSSLQSKLAEKDQQIADLYAQIEALDASLSQTSDKLAKADEEKGSLLKDNASLTSTLKKLQRDVSKLEVFRKTLMQSLQEDEESSAGGPRIVAKPTPSDDDVTFPSGSSFICSQYSSTGNSFAEDHEADGRTRVDGKEFFRQARSRLSYEQFGAFLTNVKDLNSQKQTKEETLRKANEIFGPDNRDLYAIFEGLINRNLH